MWTSDSLKGVGVSTIGQRLAILKAVYLLKVAHKIYIQPDTPSEASERLEGLYNPRLLNIQLSPILGIASDHLFCLDDLSQVSVRDLLDYHQEMSPAWRFVGQHMHWTPRIQSIANQYIRRAFSLDPTEAIPPCVAIPVQHGDWRSWCDRPVDECFAPLSAYARKVKDIKAEIQRSKGITVDRVLMTSDEKGSLWWDAARKRKWARLDHSETTKRYGAWYTVLIDEVVASGAVGFVATDRPITSVLAARRVASWQHGVVRTLAWETKRRKPLEATDAQVEREGRA
ncbi:hypothetical protein GGX14DRAFT_584062 [Mycena pura]|uniref:Uncharacterized protein n=1 Tax=Mycena pura TaxID=153505 RepID=A0AAD6YVM9_9AGAR|nr:hypothetical protein GGX14DRAFT_584062 [Mycena pura]